MCRGKDHCTELGMNPNNWDSFCLLLTPEWMNLEIDTFTKALDEFKDGNKESCLTILSTIKSREIQDWFIEHGQMSGRHRNIGLNIPIPSPIKEDLRDNTRSPKKYQEDVFVRDNYSCRYCGIRLISQKLIREFIKLLNSNEFRRGPTNKDTHGMIHLCWPVADHVIPWNLGGRTDLTNLVSSCASCNYGKDGYTIQQLGIQNPFERKPINLSWDGLISKIDNFKK